MKLITLYLPEPYITAIDELINHGFYPNRAEAIRLFVRDGIRMPHKTIKLLSVQERKIRFGMINLFGST